MKQHRRGSRESQVIDPDFADVLFESESRGPSSGRQAERKARQFCQQVKRALNLALADRSVCDDVTDLFVEDVSPAPDCGRLLVHVLIPDGSPVASMIAALGREAPRLRSEVAAAISRKRAPELCFLPAYPGGDEDE